uniref:Uncharacterized protein n=1 Tax=Arundo donax TaxID=35708 RepID=A0A0A9EIY5_ARUDO
MASNSPQQRRLLSTPICQIPLSILCWRKQWMLVLVQENCIFLFHFCCTIAQIYCLPSLKAAMRGVDPLL